MQTVPVLASSQEVTGYPGPRFHPRAVVQDRGHAVVVFVVDANVLLAGEMASFKAKHMQAA